jgi:hypothetical protein
MIPLNVGAVDVQLVVGGVLGGAFVHCRAWLVQIVSVDGVVGGGRCFLHHLESFLRVRVAHLS